MAVAKMAIIKAHTQEQIAIDTKLSRPDSLRGQDADFGRTWEPIDFLHEQCFTDFLGNEY